MNTENKEWIKEFEKLWYGLRVNNQEPPSGAINVKKTLLSFISTLIEQTEARVSKLEQIRCDEMIKHALEERDGMWKTAVSYNCEPEDIERIFDAKEALTTKPKEDYK